MAMMEITVIPVGTPSASLSDYVAKAVRVAEASGLDTYVAPMSTQIVGSTEELLVLAAQMHRSVFDDRVQRVVTTIKLDERRDKEQTADEKVRAVRDKMAQ